MQGILSCPGPSVIPRPHPSPHVGGVWGLGTSMFFSFIRLQYTTMLPAGSVIGIYSQFSCTSIVKLKLTPLVFFNDDL